MLHLLRSAVNPDMNMEECVKDWGSISRQLREAPRRREYQVPALSAKMDFLS